MQYNLDANAAKHVGGYIDEKGAYVGVFTEAWLIKSIKGSTGIHLAFKDKSGRSADRLDIYTHNTSGETIAGYGTINQIMTCLQLRSINPVEKEVEAYDFDLGKRALVKKMVFEQLLNKPIGLVLRNEQYAGNSGVKDSIKIVMPYDASSLKSAREILEGVSEAKDLANTVANLKDKLLPMASPMAAYQSENPAFGVGQDGFDDIPF